MRYTQNRPAYSQFWLCTGRSTLKKIFLSCYVDSSGFGGLSHPSPTAHSTRTCITYNVCCGLPPSNPLPKAEKRDTCRIHLATQWTAPLVAGTSRTVGMVTQTVTTDHNTDHKPNTDPKRHMKPALTLKWRKCREKKKQKRRFFERASNQTAPVFGRRRRRQQSFWLQVSVINVVNYIVQDTSTGKS